MPHHRLRPRKIAPMPSSQSQCSSGHHRPPVPRTVRASRPVTEPDLREPEDIEGQVSPDFSKCYNRTQVVDVAGNPLQMDFDCTISRGFFKVKQDWICYRRNYISVSATLVRFSSDLMFVKLLEFHKITDLAFVISAVTASDPPRPIDLVQHTPKRDKGPQRSPQFVQIHSPAYNAVWDRLQYKTATANNGKKRGQQYFSIKVTLFGYIESPDSLYKSWVELADKFSEPMIVRGRSPGHYNDSDGPRDSSSSEAEDSASFSGNFPMVKDSANLESTSPRQYIEPRDELGSDEWFQSLPHHSARTSNPYTGQQPTFPQWAFANAMPTNPVSSSRTSAIQSPRQSFGTSNTNFSTPLSEREEPIVLAPLRLHDHETPAQCGKLPTYDEVSRDCAGKSAIDPTPRPPASFGPQVVARKEEESPELQAALSLASIGNSSSAFKSPDSTSRLSAATTSPCQDSGSARRPKRGCQSSVTPTQPSRKSPRHAFRDE